MTYVKLEDAVKAVACIPPEWSRKGSMAKFNTITIEQAEKALRSLPTDDGWQPIATAPRDGEPILIYKPDERMVGEYTMTAYWSDDEDPQRNGWIPVGGIHVQGYFSNVTKTPQGHPTHWRPLPAPPAC